MGSTRLTDSAASSAPRSRRRAAVLTVLRSSGDPLTVQQVASRVGLHVNTARFHLEGLVTEGWATRAAEERTSPGRPRVLYVAAAGVPEPRSYRLLAEMLSGLVTSLGGTGSAAQDAGRAWGRHLVERPEPSESLAPADVAARLLRVLDLVGFDPEMRDAGDGHALQVALHRCPFQEVAERHPGVVCRIHEGLFQGALEELRAPLETESLEPFVAPGLCLARLRRHGSAATGEGPLLDPQVPLELRHERPDGGGKLRS